MLDKIYIIHLEKLKDRKYYLDGVLKDIKTPHEFFTSNDKSDENIILNKDFYYIYDKNKYERFLSNSEICVSVMHYKIYEDILKNKFETCLIIEDDSIFTEYYFKYIEHISERNDYDMCFISECCGLHKPPSKNDILVDSDTSRCTTSYIVKGEKIKSIINSLPFNYPIDWHLNQIKDELGLVFKWSEPCLIRQGSEFIYKSNLR